MWIVFEGPDGAGKTTMAQKLADFLTAQGHNVIKTSHPGSTELGLQLRELIKTAKTPINALAIQHMMAADWQQFVTTVLNKHLRFRGTIVISDRCNPIGGIVYGTAMEAASFKTLYALYRTIQTPSIDLLVRLESDSATLNKRLDERKRDSFESAMLAEKVREMYRSPLLESAIDELTPCRAKIKLNAAEAPESLLLQIVARLPLQG